jgi:hypothetical protein
MKHIKLFKKHSEYEIFKDGEAWLLPNLSYVVNTNKVHYASESKIPHGYETFILTDGVLEVSEGDFYVEI